MTQHNWVAAHPYLQPLASLHAQVNSALGEIMTAANCVPAWDSYADDFRAGIPLLQSSKVSVDLQSAERRLLSVVGRLAALPLPQPLAERVRTLDVELRRSKDASRCAMACLIHHVDFACSCPGLLRYLGWTVLSRHLHPVTEAFARWRVEDNWMRSYCPACGSLPAMAQFAGKDQGRCRLLCCGCCNTRWSYQRMSCPFCERQNNQRLAVLMVEGEPALRIDYCEACHGYLKTYNGEGNESVLLSDWTSIHFDLAAQNSGLKRLAASLYEL